MTDIVSLLGDEAIMLLEHTCRVQFGGSVRADIAGGSSDKREWHTR